jgi:hypothetical protein
MMRGSPKITRIQLKVNQNIDSVLVGIVSAEPDYKLSLSINRKLRISLKRGTSVVATDENGNELSFSRFTDNQGLGGSSCELVSNRFEKNFLIRKLRNVDYIFQIHNPGNEPEIEKIISGLRGTESVTAVFNIDPKSLKDKNLHHLIQ